MIWLVITYASLVLIALSTIGGLISLYKHIKQEDGERIAIITITGMVGVILFTIGVAGSCSHNIGEQIQEKSEQKTD